ncbi:MFS transporter [Herbiconiux sp. L3-i23]|uniref:MFS transporter n=1 Tax=Herbiconiux sp. L3-i23 TaxID=2905871 RepID=UPI002048200C|nr:MFS transporter [Herbiconiux sp. L3-i23]BDI21680.1 MFS transporter [Herbiconiux sp. L3-i23]
MSAVFRSLRAVNYRIWFAGALVSNVGTWMQRTAQDWLVLTELTDHDAVAVGITMALQFGPLLVLGPFAGVLVDRLPGRRLLIGTQLAQAVLAVGLGAIVLSGAAELWMVYGFALLLGVVTAIDNPTRQTFVSELVPSTDLPNAVALNSASFNGARLVGPAVAGLAIAAIGTGWVFLVNAVTYASVLAALVLLRRDQLHAVTKAARGRGQMREGLRYVRSRPDIVTVLVIVTLVGTFGFNFPIYTSTMARIEFGADSSAFGLLSSILAIGSVTGALFTASRERPRVRSVVLAAVGFGLATAAAAIMPGYWSFAATLVLVGVSSMILMTSANGYVQSTTPGRVRGRVMSIYMALFAGTTFIGAPAVGFVADAFGPRAALAVAALSGLLGGAVGVVWLMSRRAARADERSTLRATVETRGDLATDLELDEITAREAS